MLANCPTDLGLKKPTLIYEYLPMSQSYVGCCNNGYVLENGQIEPLETHATTHLDFAVGKVSIDSGDHDQSQCCLLVKAG